MYLQRNQVENLARKLAPTAIQRVGGGVDNNELIRLAVGISAVETDGSFHIYAKNPSSTARGIMQTLICTQREVENKFNFGFAPASKKPDSSCAVPNVPQNVVPQAQDKMYDPEYSLLIGMTYLAYQLKRYGNDEKKAVVAFNQGNASPEATRRARGYLSKFMKHNPEHPLSQQLASEGYGNSSGTSTNLATDTKKQPARSQQTASLQTSSAKEKNGKKQQSFVRNAAIALFMRPVLRPRIPLETASKTTSSTRSLADSISSSMAKTQSLSLKDFFKPKPCGCSAH